MVGVLLLAQWGLFRQFVLREVAWTYPAHQDQIQYLTWAYDTYERILADGLWRGLRHGASALAPQGMLIHLEAALLFLLIGASRLSALTLNFIHLALFQIVLVWTVRWLSGRWSIAFLGLGLLLSAGTPFLWAGGLMDFRCDFLAFCLFGIFVCTAIRSGIFVSTRWSAVAGGVAAVLGLVRFIAFVYVVGILAAVAAFVLLRSLRTPNFPRQHAYRQLSGIGLCAAILLGFVLPALWVNRGMLQDYYVVGHLSGDEKYLRAREQGIISVGDHVRWYPASLLQDHAGPAFLWTGGMAVAAALTRRLRRRRIGVDGHAALEPRDAWAFLAASVLVPLLILTADIAKSPVVGGILVPPLLWMIVFAVILLWRASSDRGHPGSNVGLAMLGAAALLVGVHNQFDNLGRRGQDSQTHSRSDVEQFLQLCDLIGEYSRRLRWSQVWISTDSVTDYLQGRVIGIELYERKGVLLEAGTALGGSILRVTEPDVWRLLRASHFVIVTTRGLPERPTYPAEEMIRALHPKVRQFCEQNLVALRTFRFFGREVVLYARPGLILYGDSGGWITSEGLTLIDPGSVLRLRPKVALRGQTDFGYLKAVPRAEAEVKLADGTSRTIPAALTSSGTHYCLSLDTAGAIDGATAADPVIHLSFDRHFVPKEIGLNQDPRKLVIMKPQEVTLHAASEQAICQLPAQP